MREKFKHYEIATQRGISVEDAGADCIWVDVHPLSDGDDNGEEGSNIATVTKGAVIFGEHAPILEYLTDVEILKEIVNALNTLEKKGEINDRY